MILSEHRESKDKWYVYIAITETGYYYTGISNDVFKRIDAHNLGKGAKFSRMHGKFKLLYSSAAMTKSNALKREIQIKGWTRDKKQKLIAGALK